MLKATRFVLYKLRSFGKMHLKDRTDKIQIKNILFLIRNMA